MELIFATNNQHKVEEIQAVIGNKLRIITLRQAGILIDIPEPHNTLEANASEKSRTIYNLTGKNCFSEDTGLEVEALEGKPGVRSARYAGNNSTSKENVAKLLKNMEGKLNRRARFRTVISLQLNAKEYLFEGICEGTIGYRSRGENGFGYDSVFTPLNNSQTFAEMTIDQKAGYSHRSIASHKLVLFLQECDIAD